MNTLSLCSLSHLFINVSIFQTNRLAWSLHIPSFSLCLLNPHHSCLYCYIMTSSAVSCTLSGFLPLSDLLSLLMCCVQASVWWWAWCSISPVLMTRWWTGRESLSSSSTTTMAGPSPSLPLPSYSKRSVWQSVTMCGCLHILYTMSIEYFHFCGLSIVCWVCYQVP